MTLFKYQLKIIAKHKLMLLSYFVIFVIIGFIFVSSTNTAKVNDLSYDFPIAVINHDKNNKVNDGLETFLKGKFSTVQLKDDEKSIKDALFYQVVGYVLVINPDGTYTYYGNKNDVTEFTMQMMIHEYLRLSSVYEKHSPSGGLDPITKIVNTNIPVEFINQSDKDHYDNLTGYYRASPYIFSMIIMFTVYYGYKEFNKSSMKKRLEISGKSKNTISQHLLIGSCVTVVMLWILFVLSSFVVVGFKPIGFKEFLFMENALIMIVPLTIIGFILNRFVKKQQSINGFATMLSLFLCFLSGVFIPLEFLPSAVQKFATILPTYWFVKANSMIATFTSYSVKEFLFCQGMQLLISVGLLALLFIINRERKTNISAIKSQA